MKISPIGVGTYKGSYDSEDDLVMFNAVIDSVLLGCNVIDSCRNFRKGRSESIIRLALNHLLEKEQIGRDQLFVGSKGGYVFEELPSGVTS